MSNDVQQVFLPDADEAWERLTDNPEVRGVGSARIDEIGGWQGHGLRAGRPLETELRQRIGTALRAAKGVLTVDEEDREAWFVTGTPAGKELTEAAARVVDELAGDTRAFIDGL